MVYFVRGKDREDRVHLTTLTTRNFLNFFL